MDTGTSGPGRAKQFYPFYSREIIELLRSTYGEKLRIFESIIPLSIRAAETSAEGRSIYLHDPAGKVAAAYAALTQEVLA